METIRKKLTQITMTSGGFIIVLVTNNSLNAVRNHVKLIHVVTSRRGFSKGTVLCGGY